MASLLDTPSSGKVLLEGKEVSQYTEPQLAKVRNKAIGFVFQQFNLLPKTTALENVALPLIYANVPYEERVMRSKAILERVGLGNRMGNTRTQMSGGQQQRVAIARALVTEPSLIFADEPTGNLDSKSGDEIMHLFLELHQEGKTIVMVTHEEDVAAFAERIVRVKDGKVLSDKKQKQKKSSLV
jgi:putative ABC transport system ATP-binding protein